jgi:hypothetical protein
MMAIGMMLSPYIQTPMSSFSFPIDGCHRPEFIGMALGLKRMDNIPRICIAGTRMITIAGYGGYRKNIKRTLGG